MNRSTRIFLNLLAVSIIGIGAIGIIGSTTNTYIASIKLDAPINDVFQYLSEPELRKKWLTDLVRVEVVEPTHNDPVGTIEELTIENNGKQSTYRSEIIRYSKGQLISFQVSSSIVVETLVFELKWTDDLKTELTYRVRSNNKGLGVFLNPLLNRGDRAAVMNEECLRFKELVEGELTE